MLQSIPTPLGGRDPSKPRPSVPKPGGKERCSRVSIQG
jgi:hypothetical protein